MTIKSEFIDRQDELSYLEKEYMEGDFKFISIIGRRRIGKTRLIEEFIRNKQNSVYFLVQEMDDMELRRSLAERLHQKLKLSFIGTPSWETIFEELFLASMDSRIILVLDEFQRFLVINRSVPSILQGAVDRHAGKSGLFLVVMGSSIGMMHRLFDYTSALYGRRTGQMNIQPINPFFLKDWFPGTSLEKIIEIYSIFGGTPKYLEDVEPKKSIMWNIKEKILSKRSILYSEPEILVKTELSDSSTYFNILKLISEGKSKPGEIAGFLTVKQTSLSYFLSVLEHDMELVKREVAVTERKERSKKAIYRMSDNFFRFWFRYVYPYRSDIEIENTVHLAEKIERELNSFTGRSFEDICRVALLKPGLPELPFKPVNVGSWWGFHRKNGARKEIEIDIVALNEQTKDILFCECKWQDAVNAGKVFSDLKEKAGFVEWNRGTRKEHYAVFAKSFKEKIRERDLFLFELKDLEAYTKDIL
ncbi:MAG TPA: ATP-binding protein [Candidatus Methanoperedenaceae archaeon]|nr:ATP-binding protein [Candidatus Methanoperedenaceae archaeon]